MKNKNLSHQSQTGKVTKLKDLHIKHLKNIIDKYPHTDVYEKELERRLKKDKHSVLRYTQTWGGKGQLGEDATTWRPIAEISDSHLLHIIGWIRNNDTVYRVSTYELMLEEAAYRSRNNIFVPEYK